MEKIEYKDQKLTNFFKKKRIFGSKMVGKNVVLVSKNWEKIEYKGQKLTNFQIKKKKKDFSGQKKQGWEKIWGKKWVKGSKIPKFSKKKKK